MKKKYSHFMRITKFLRKSSRKIQLIDKCIIIFMIILLGQCIFNLFSNDTSMVNQSNIDTLIRTTTASIFGYFLSANFIKKCKSNDDKINSSNNENITNSTCMLTKTDFDLPLPQNNNNDNSLDEVDDIDDCEEEISEQQIIIVTIIGVVSLLAIVLARDLDFEILHSNASISQLRDFVSGAVGFLIGCPNKNTSNK